MGAVVRLRAFGKVETRPAHTQPNDLVVADDEDATDVEDHGVDRRPVDDGRGPGS